MVIPRNASELDLRIHYAKTPDGVNLAYWTAGDGEPLLFLPTLVSNVESDWRTTRGKAYARLAEHHMLVRYDGRGHGMSDRDPKDISLDTLVTDLKTIVDELGIERFAIFAPSLSATTALAFAARYPERVSRMVLFQPFASYADYFHSSLGAALPLLRENWELFVMTVSHIRMGWVRPEQALGAAALLRDAVNQDVYIREVEAADAIEAHCLTGSIKTPTLVLCRRDYGDYELGVARSLAAAVGSPGTELEFAL